MNAPKRDWNERYATGDLPWDTGRHDRCLEKLVSTGAVEPCRALELGCGTGSNAIWLALQGFDVSAVDLSPLAVRSGTAKAKQAGVEVRFVASDVFDADVPVDAFGFVFDRGCFHSFSDPSQRDRFVEYVSSHLKSGGLWLSMMGSKDSPPRDEGPPMLSARDVMAHVEPRFEIIHFEATHFDSNQSSPPAAWGCIMKKRRNQNAYA